MKRFILTLAVPCVSCVLAFAQPATIGYQGFLETGGIPVNGNQNMTFSLYTALTGGIQIWTETKSVPVADGIYHTALGDVTTLEGTNLNQDLWLAIQVGGSTLTPRTKLSGVPYAHTLHVPALISGTATTPILSALNLQTAGNGVGMQGGTNADNGQGVIGIAYSTTGLTFGVQGTTNSNAGRGVFGRANATTGVTSGVYGQAASASGRGVFGTALAATGLTYGVRGESASNTGTGVFGKASAASGTTFGVTGEVTSANGYPGFFSGGKGLYTQGGSNAGADVILGGTSNSNDDGRVFTDPAYDSSDMWLHTNDAVVIRLDYDGSGEDSDFSIRDKDNNTIFNVDEDGTVSVMGSTEHVSDVNRKEGFAPVDVDAVLQGVVSLPMMRWRYKGQRVSHLGPMAQDFHAAFAVGKNETTISAVDADGVALAAIQGLYRRVAQQNQEIKALTRRLTQLEALVIND